MSRYEQEFDEVQPNLIPIMNLFTALIPFLLMSAVFFRLSVIQISVPVASASGETDIAKEDDKITLNVQLFPDRFDVSASSDTLDPSIVKTLRATIPRPKSDDQEPALTQLSKEAHAIKVKYPASDTVIVVPEDEILYADIIDTMDACRHIKVEAEGGGGRVLLFNRVVLSNRVK